MTQEKQLGYKSPPTAYQWRPGQSGNPSGKKKAVKKPSQPLPAMFAAQLDQTTEITIAGKKKSVTMGEVLARQFIHNLIKAPIKLQAEAIKILLSLGVIDQQKVLPEPEDDDEHFMREDDRRLLEIIRSEVGLDFDEKG